MSGYLSLSKMKVPESFSITYTKATVMKLDALIIHPNSHKVVYQGLSNSAAAIEPPIWASLLTNALRAKGHSVDIIDSEGSMISNADAAKKAVGEYRPRLVVVVVYGQQPSASTQNMHGASELCREIKRLNPDQKVLMLGGHVSALPERTLREESVDFTCKGEGLYTIEGLLTLGMSDKSDLSKIQGLYFWLGDKVVANPTATLIPQEKLHIELPGMAWDLLPMRNYRAHNWHSFDRVNERSPYASVYTSLGCPFKCSFCCINAPFNSSSFRFWDPQFMVKEFDILAERYGVRNIKIADEMFVLNPNHYLALCKLLEERNHGFNIWAYARIDTVKEQFLRQLKAAGVNWLALGIEAGSDQVRNDVTKGRFKKQDVINTVRRIQEAGINVIGNFIFGLPEDNFSTMQETLELAKELNCEMANFYSAMAYPGSQLYNEAVKEGWPLPDSWAGFSQHSFECRPLPTKHISGEQVLAFRDRAWSDYFTSPKYLDLVQQRFGNEAHQHLVEVSKYELKRKFVAEIPQSLSL